MTDDKIDDAPDVPLHHIALRSGDVVQLRGNIQPMVVEYTGRNGSSANCAWHDQAGQLHREWFRSVMLEMCQ